MERASDRTRVLTHEVHEFDSVLVGDEGGFVWRTSEWSRCRWWMWRCCGLKAAEVLWGQGLCLEAGCPATLRCHRWRSSSWKYRFLCLEAKSRRGQHGYRRFPRAEKTVVPQFLDEIMKVMELEPEELINENIVEVPVPHVREETEEVINRDQFLDRCSCGTRE